MKQNIKKSAHWLTSTAEGRTRLVVFFLILVLNILTVKTSDDLGYSISFGLADIIRREYVQYMTWTGRTVAHLIARCFLALPKGVFNVCSSLVFCFQIELMARLAQGSEKPAGALLYGGCALCVFLYAPLFGQSVLWETGSCNYLWTTTIILALLYQYAVRRRPITGVLPLILFFLFGMAAGWTNENTGGACILMLGVYILLSYRKTKKVPLWMLVGLCGSIVGFLAMILAPGNAIRAADFVNEGGKAYVLVHDLFNTIRIFASANAQLPLWLAFGASLGLLIWKKKLTQQTFICIAFALSGMAAVGAILLSPVPVEFDRSMYGATIFVIIAAAGLLHALSETEQFGYLLPAAVSLLGVFAVFTYAGACVDLSYTFYQVHNREAWVKAQKEQGNLNPTVPVINSEFFTTYNAMYGLNDILEYPEFVNNANYALTHGIESVTSTSVEKWNALYRNGNPSLMNTLDMETYLTNVKANPDWVAVITSSTLYENDAAFREVLSSVFEIETGQASHLIIIAGPSVSVKTDDAPFGMEESLDGHYVWIESGEDGEHSDIVIDGTEYTNDAEGISVVVFDRNEGRAVDSVTWNRDYGMRGIRSYVER